MNTKLEEKARAYLLNAGLSIEEINRLESIGYFTAPAAMRHHLNRPQGLIEHSINVTDKILAFNVFADRKSAFRVGMLHDVIKCRCYALKENDGKISYSYVQPPYPGHGVASALLLSDLGISLTQEERAAIVWHMGAYNLAESDLEQYRAVKLRFPRAVLLVHAADDLAATFETLSAHKGKGE